MHVKAFFLNVLSIQPEVESHKNIILTYEEFRRKTLLVLLRLGSVVSL